MNTLEGYQLCLRTKNRSRATKKKTSGINYHDLTFWSPFKHTPWKLPGRSPWKFNGLRILRVNRHDIPTRRSTLPFHQYEICWIRCGSCRWPHQWHGQKDESMKTCSSPNPAASHRCKRSPHEPTSCLYVHYWCWHTQGHLGSSALSANCPGDTLVLFEQQAMTHHCKHGSQRVVIRHFLTFLTLSLMILSFLPLLSAHPVKFPLFLPLFFETGDGSPWAPHSDLTHAKYQPAFSKKKSQLANTKVSRIIVQTQGLI